MFEIAFYIAIAFVLAVAFSEYEHKKEEMTQRKRPVKFTTRRWITPEKREHHNCNENGWEITERDGVFHQWGNDIEFDGDPQEPLNVTIGICEDEHGEVFTVNPNDIHFKDKGISNPILLN